MKTQVANDRPTHHDGFKAATAVAKEGLKLVKVYGFTKDGVCECNSGARCPSPGKHPIGYEWQKFATTDENTIAEWFEDEERPVFNFGVLLGEASGVIDVEADTEEALAALKQWGLDQIDTPAFQSGRSPHFLYKWETGLPNKAVVKVDGIECRLGNEKASQTVLPPSWHGSGVAREWLPGRSPGECDLQPLPKAFRDAVIRAGGGKGKGITKAAREA
ncbi:MAG: bifunctional DNA primase/polymerase, partial [Verrucomicrobiales bacterium]